jgi:exodeoxyribonuclease V alpha subunit
MPFLRGRITDIKHRDPTTGETVARIGPEDRSAKGASFPFYGSFAYELSRGECVEIHGEWEMHPRHGKALRVTKLERRPPVTREGEVSFLTGYIKGMTGKVAQELLDKFGGLEGLKEASQKRPKDIEAALPRSRKVCARLLKAQWDRKEMDVDGVVALRSAGLKSNQIQQLVRFFGAGSLRIMAQNEPYSFCRVPGVGFKTVEKLAQFYADAQGRSVNLYDADRLVFGIRDVLSRVAQDGDVCIAEEELVRRAVRHLGLPDSDKTMTALRAALSKALKLRLLIKEYEMIYPRGLHRAEKEVALHIRKHLASGGAALSLPKRKILADLEASGLSREQMEAVTVLCSSPMSILVGGPGRGKTRTLATFVELLEKHRRSYLLLAPTGKAAKRAAEVTGRMCSTIHKACGLDREEDIHNRKPGRTIGAKEKLKADVVIVDESSMIGLQLALDLVRRCKSGKTTIVWVGDPDQLPPVSPGHVLKDMLRSTAVPVARLTQVFRQKNGSPIVDAADAMNNGLMPSFPDSGYQIRLFDPTTSPAHPGPGAGAGAADFEVSRLQGWLLQGIERYSKDLGLDPLRDIQVYAPQRTGPLGLAALNMSLQALLNPATKHTNTVAVKVAEGFPVRAGDKVIQTANNYRLRLASAPSAVRAGKGGDKRTTGPVADEAEDRVAVMNGQVGYVVSADPVRGVHVQYEEFSEPVAYLRADEWRALSPCFAMSIHRSQGSETRFAFVVLHESMNLKLMNRPLVYTALTRAKEGAAFFGTRSALQKAVENMGGVVRLGNLHRRLSDTGAAGRPGRIRVV